MSDKDVFLWVIKSYLGTFYRWGGDDPSGFDCSGLVLEGLQSVGKIASNTDMTAATMWERFKAFSIATPHAGALVFYCNKHGKVIHVEVCITESLAIGESGGGHRVKTEADAIAFNAFVKVRPIYGRPGSSDIKGIVDLFDHPDIIARVGDSQ